MKQEEAAFLLLPFTILPNDAFSKQGEKLLNNLGGMFAMPWKAKKGKDISGPDFSAGVLLL